MNSGQATQEPDPQQANCLSVHESPLELSFLNPVLMDGAPGAVAVAKRRVGVFLAALAAGNDGHPTVSDGHLRETVQQELWELQAILEAIARELEKDDKLRGASAEGGKP